MMTSALLHNITHWLSKLSALLIATTTLSACLNEDTRDRLGSDETYADASSLMLNTVATLYNYIGGHEESQGLQGTYNGVYDLNTFTTDEAMLPTRGGDWYDGGWWQSLYLHTWKPRDTPFYNTWCYLYKVIMLCNSSLETLKAHESMLTTAQYQEATAEVRGLRAMYYFYAMDLFGNIPLVTDSQAKPSDVAQVPRSQTFNFVYDELRDVAPYLNEAHSNQQNNYYGRFTRPVAYFLLAKLALNAEIYSDDNWTDGRQPQGNSIMLEADGRKLNAWQACITWCDKLKEEGYKLANDYASNFSIHNETSEENIFIIPMDKYLYTNQYQYLFRTRHYKHGGALGMDAENGTCATLSAVEAYGYGTDSLDNRYSINFSSDTLRIDGKVVTLDDGTPLVYDPLAVRLDLKNSPKEKTAGARMAKYETDRQAFLDGKLQSNDIVLFRYADVVLMRAEAMARDGQDAAPYLNEIRARVNMPDRKATLGNILKERLLEMMWEGWRRNDLIRFGLFHKAYDQRPQQANEEKGYTTVFPIPQRVLDLNHLLKQNPGYPTE